MTANLPLVQVSHLSKHYEKANHWFARTRKRVPVLQDLSFVLQPNTITGLIGESGSGKSTLALILAGLLRPSSGSMIFQQRHIHYSVSHDVRFLRSQVKMVFQDPYSSLNPRKTILYNLGHPLLYHRVVQSKQEQRDRVVQALEAVNLSSEFLDCFPHQMSGGQQQRASIARALLGNPQLIICDEVVSALDLSTQIQLLQMMKDIHDRQHMNYLFISHDLSVVQSFCSQVIIMYKGRIVEMGLTESIFRHPKHPYTQMLLASQLADTPGNVVQRPVVPPFIEGDTTEEEATCNFYHRCPYRQDRCKYEEIPDRKQGDHCYRCVM